MTELSLVGPIDHRWVPLSRYASPIGSPTHPTARDAPDARRRVPGPGAHRPLTLVEAFGLLPWADAKPVTVAPLWMRRDGTLPSAVDALAAPPEYCGGAPRIDQLETAQGRALRITQKVVAEDTGAGVRVGFAWAVPSAGQLLLTVTFATAWQATCWTPSFDAFARGLRVRVTS